MDFSIIIPSRDRPHLLEQAILSVLEQTYAPKEVIVVNDGSNQENQALYEQLQVRFEGVVRFVNLERTARGHGPSYAINRGAEHASGEFLCFLDDDDSWTDKRHLERAKAVLDSSANDLYLTNQSAFTGETLIQERLWLQVIADRIQEKYVADGQGAYDVTITDLMACDSFPHLNNTIVRRNLYVEVGGMDEAIRYECEWDLYFRLIDRARGIKYFPGIVSRHNVPDKNKTNNVSTAVSEMQKLLLRSYVMDKALLFTQAKPIARAAKRNKMYTLKKITICLAGAREFGRALVYAKLAATGALNVKWRLYTAYLALRALPAQWK